MFPPNCSQAHYRRGFALLKLGQAQNAKHALKSSLALNPSDVIVKETLAHAVFELSKDEYKRLCADRAPATRVEFVPGKGDSSQHSVSYPHFRQGAVCHARD